MCFASLKEKQKITIWKSHGNFKLEQNAMEKSWNLRNKFKIQLTCMSIRRSWNFVIRTWKSHGKVMEFCRYNFMATPRISSTKQYSKSCLTKLVHDLMEITIRTPNNIPQILQ